MKKYTLEELLTHAGVKEAPEVLGRFYEAYEPEETTEVIRKEFLTETCEKYGVDAGKQERLLKALAEIEADPMLATFYQFLRWGIVESPDRVDIEFAGGFGFSFSQEYPDCSKFLFLFSCIEPAEKELRRRGIPMEECEDIPWRRVVPQLKKYQETGNCEMSDFPWDRNFYTRSIFQCDRFYFIPYRTGEPYRFYRNVKSGKVVALYEAGYGVAKDGQLVAAENADAEVAFTTVFEETADEYSGTYMNPCGFFSETVMHLSKSEWKEVLKSGDLTLALHIPGGEGYNPTRLQNSMEIALNFYDKYFPELPIKGFWSESWLYDNRLSFLLPATSNIVEVQRRFYNYSFGGNGEHLRVEVFHDPHVDLTKVTPKTTLEKKVVATVAAGNDFCGTSMIVLREDVPRVEKEYTYVTEEDLKEHDKVVGSIWKEA